MTARGQPDTASVPPGYRLLALGDVDSTNAHAARLAGEGETGPLWIWAGRQTAGRGRRGRNWVSEPGNLYATLLISLPVEPAVAAQLGFAAALAIHDLAAEALGSADDLRLKWPNDVLLSGAKLSGVLSEVLSAGQGAPVLVALGCGVNLAHAPQHTPYGATSLSAHGAVVSPDWGIAALAGAMDRWLTLWNGGAGFEHLRQAWQHRSFPPGHPLTLTVGTETIHGHFRALTASGALVLQLPDGGERSFNAGEVISTSWT